MSNQIFDLERIAAASAVLRGHKLGEWRFQEGVAAASCIWCNCELLVYSSLLQPDMDGAALEHDCLDEHRKILVRTGIRL